MKTRKRKPTAIDLFCGCGGLTQGIKDAGFNVLVAVDNDPDAILTYEANHPEVVTLTDNIKNVLPKDIMNQIILRKEGLDLLAGCPPCQGFSSIRRKNRSIDSSDERNDLIFQFYRFAKVFKPKVILMENVSGLPDYDRFKDFIKLIEKLGYQTKHQILNASDYGVPQRRKRMIFIASRIGDIDFPKSVEKRVTVREKISHLPIPGDTGDPLHDFPEKRTKRIIDLIKMIPKDGGGRLDLDNSLQLKCHQKSAGFHDIYGRMKWDDVAPTITCGCTNPSKGRFLHPEQDRAITMREAALLQSFPAKYIFPEKLGKTKITQQIGNAFPPLFVKNQSIKILEKICDSHG